MRPPTPTESREARQRLILDHVLTRGQVTAPELAELTGRSLMTVHRDLDDLASRQLVRRFHGGVSALPTSVFESSSEFRLHRRVAEKDALAAAAASMVEPGMSVMLDDSTTVLALARLLPEKAPITVVTNYLQVFSLLSEVSDVRLIVIGGQYSRTHDSFIGPPDQTNIESYAVDIAFQSTSTMDETMTYHQEQDVVSMKRTMLRSGTRRVLLMDGAKVGHTSLHRFVPVSAFTDVLLTTDADPEIAARVGEQAALQLIEVESAPRP